MTLEERAFRKATRRLIPFLFLIYVVAYLDRVNVSFAQLQRGRPRLQRHRLRHRGRHLLPRVRDLRRALEPRARSASAPGAGFAAIMVVWGVISMVEESGTPPRSTCCASPGRRRRGFFPGIILFLTGGFSSERTRVLALFLTAISLAYVAGPLWGPARAGRRARPDGWQWLFLVEAPCGARRDHPAFPRRGSKGADWLEPRSASSWRQRWREVELKQAMGGRDWGRPRSGRGSCRSSTS